jgi:hypothetical protein
MNRHQFLTVVHERYQPRSYLEVGINDGRGLARSRTRTIGVDPDFRITVELACELQLVKATSDNFFARPDALSWFPEGVVDLTFIDGMHLVEFALRDFINAERSSTPAGVVIFDDVFPRSVAEAARDRQTSFWAGDIYKVMLVLERYRPDLTVIPLDTAPTGLLLVLGLDPTNTVLADQYEQIVAEYATHDPQAVPDVVLHRRTAADPEQVADSRCWAELVAARTTGATVTGLEELRSLRGTAAFTLVPPPDTPWKTRPAAPPPTPPPPAASVLRRIRRAIKNRL